MKNGLTISKIVRLTGVSGSHRRRPPGERIGVGAIARIRPSPTLRAELEKAGPGGAGHTYAANGLWYDALDFVSRWIPERPGEPSLRSRRAELLEQTGLKAAADYDRLAIGAE